MQLAMVHIRNNGFKRSWIVKGGLPYMTAVGEREEWCI